MSVRSGIINALLRMKSTELRVEHRGALQITNIDISVVSQLSHCFSSLLTSGGSGVPFVHKLLHPFGLVSKSPSIFCRPRYSLCRWTLSSQSLSFAAGRRLFVPHRAFDRFRKAGYAAIDQICDYYYGLASKPVSAQVQPGFLINALPTAPPLKGEPIELIASDYQVRSRPPLESQSTLPLTPPYFFMLPRHTL